MLLHRPHFNLIHWGNSHVMANNKCFFELLRLQLPALAGRPRTNICSVTWRSNRDSRRFATKAKCERDMSFKCTAEVASTNRCPGWVGSALGVNVTRNVNVRPVLFYSGKFRCKKSSQESQQLNTWPFLFPKLKSKHLVYFLLKKKVKVIW